MSMEMKIRKLLTAIKICVFPSSMGVCMIVLLGVSWLDGQGLIKGNVGPWILLFLAGGAFLGQMPPSLVVRYAESILPPMHRVKNEWAISIVATLLVMVVLLMISSSVSPDTQWLMFSIYCVIMIAALVVRNILAVVLLRKVNIFKNRKF